MSAVTDQAKTGQARSHWREPSGALLTVAIPTRNRPDLLARALRSVVGGGAVPVPPGSLAARVEVVVSDNASDPADERSRVIAETLLEGWPGATRYIRHRPDVAMVDNFNSCLRESSADYVLVMHDDDYLLPGGLEHIVGTLQSSESQDVLLFGVALVDLDGRVQRRQRFRASRTLQPAAALERVLTNSSFVRAPAIIVRRSAYEEVGLFDDLDGPEDVDMEVKLFSRYGVRCVAATTAAYTIHAGAATTSMFTPETIGKFQTIFERARQTRVLDERTVRRSQAAFLHQFILGGAWRALRIRDRARARQVLELFTLPDVRAVGISPRWLPVRIAFGLLTIGSRP